MVMAASSEFTSLCQSQVALLTEGLGACLGVVYLAEEPTDNSDSKLVPVVTYPETITGREEDEILSLVFRGIRRDQSNSRLLSSQEPDMTGELSSLALPTYSDSTEFPSLPASVSRALARQQQMVLPLMYEGVVIGLLVTARADRSWNDSERRQIEDIARTLAIACMLDQRGQWLANDLQRYRELRNQQHDLLDDLLHQFRNPLTALRTFGKLLLRRIVPEDPNRSAIEGMVRESDRLRELLQQFEAAIDLDESDVLPYRLNSAPIDLELSARLEDEDVTQSEPSRPNTVPLLPGASLLGTQAQLEPVQVTDVLDPLLVSAEAIAQERQLTLQVQLPLELPPVQADLRALREVLSNLIDNALKYTPAGGQIWVMVCSSVSDATGSQQAIVIADTGPGIPPEDQSHLFERHYRGVQAETEIPGTGLGLAIARDLMTQMQGDIQVISPAADCPLLNAQQLQGTTDENPGTAVVVSLPQVG